MYLTTPRMTWDTETIHTAMAMFTKEVTCTTYTLWITVEAVSELLIVIYWDNIHSSIAVHTWNYETMFGRKAFFRAYLIQQ